MNSNYQVIRIVGRGSFGTAHLCLRKLDHQHVVIKQIPVDEMDVEDQKAAQNEVRVLAMLDHPNVIDYHESFIENRALHIVMEYASGGTLHNHLKERGGRFFTPEELMYLFCQMVVGLDHIHSLNIIHRDIKPKNILMVTSRETVVKIGDFGISKVLESTSRASTLLGTQSYWPPELCAGQRYNQSSDIWALGCVLYEMMTFRRAFEASNLVALAMKIVRSEVEAYDLTIYPDRYLATLLEAMMSRKPELRPSARETLAHPAVLPHYYQLQERPIGWNLDYIVENG